MYCSLIFLCSDYFTAFVGERRCPLRVTQCVLVSLVLLSRKCSNNVMPTFPHLMSTLTNSVCNSYNIHFLQHLFTDLPCFQTVVYLLVFPL